MLQIEIVSFNDRPTSEQLSRKSAVIVADFPHETNASFLEYALNLGSISRDGITSSSNKVEDGAIHLVQERSSPALDPYHNVMLSTTNSYFPLHTDEYFSATPARFVLLLCVAGSEIGGTSLVSYVDDIVESIEPNDLKLLASPLFPTQVGLRPILSDTQAGWNVRFNNMEMERAQKLLGNRNTLRFDAKGAAERFQQVADLHIRRHSLKSGECLVLSNYRALHGRTEFPSGSGRLLKRIRVK